MLNMTGRMMTIFCENCLKETRIIIKDIKKIFTQGDYKLNKYTQTHKGDPSGKLSTICIKLS